MKYMSVAILMALSCLLFVACSSEPDLSPYTDKIAQLQSTLDSLTSGSAGGGSSISLSPELQGQDALLNSQIETLKKELQSIETKHKSDIEARQKEIDDLEEILLKIEGGADLAEIRKAMQTLQTKKEEQIKEQEANLAALEENKKKLEQDLLDATDNENKWGNLLALENVKTYAQQKGLPSIGLVSVTLSRQEREATSSENEGEESSSEYVNTFLPYNTYEFIYDNGTEVRMNFYDHPKGQECIYNYAAAYPNDCNYDDFRLIKISNNSDVVWFRHNISREASKYYDYYTNLVSEKKEYLDERRILYSGDKKEYESYSQNLSYEGHLKDNGEREVSNDKTNPETPNIIEELFYKGLAGTDLPKYLARNYITIFIKTNTTQTGSFMERTVKEEYYTPNAIGEFELTDNEARKVCKEYTVGTGDGGYWRETNKPCYYK